MAKTVFSSGVIVTSQWLNGSQQIYFDGQTDLDWHYDPLGLTSLITAGPNGLDSRYVTLQTEQPVLSTISPGVYESGTAIEGGKVVTGPWQFGYDETLAGNIIQGIVNDVDNAPKSFTTNSKYDYANGTIGPTIAQKFAALDEEDLVTKKVLADQVETLANLDNGIYYSAGNPSCTNYDTGSNTICPA